VITIDNNISNILIIDDDEFSRMYNEFTLRDTMNYKGFVKMCSNGQLGIDYLINTIEQDLPDFILLDINMPIMNGFEFIEEFQKIKNSFTKEISIFMLTSSVSQRDKSTINQYPEVKGFLSKPIDHIALLNLIENNSKFE